MIAYEPVWAIGTARPRQAPRRRRCITFIRGVLVGLREAVARRVRIQYGGSVKPSNARELMSQPDVDGAWWAARALEVRSFADIV